MKYKFEKNVIDVILNTIKKHQVYLTQPENLPQLAKLGYLYNTLWYAGRVCWGYDGIISKTNQCEDNPKYKIENCCPKTKKIENLIYDAWGMHINDESPTDWNTFNSFITEGKELSELEVALLKPNKTIEDWVECLTNPEYAYPYENRRRVVDNLLCTIGTEYGYKDGYIIQEASGANQDLSLYGNWQNAKFRDDIKLIINKILSIPEVKDTIDTHYKFIKDIIDKKDAIELEKDIRIFGMSFKDWAKSGLNKKLNDVFLGRPIEKYENYYPISEYSNITKFDKNTHKSYIDAGIEICKDILDHKNVEEKCNIKFAKKFLCSPFIRKEKLDNLNNIQ